jgi:Tfp pilus assembly protein PilF
MRSFGMKAFTLAPAALRAAGGIAVVVAALAGTGCAKLTARDHLNQGVNAFKTGNYAQAADQFRLAIDADPSFGVARLYLATAYEQQFVPGTETDENKKYWKAAMDEFQSVLKAEPGNLLATQSVANLYYQAKDNVNAIEWNKKVIALDPKNKEAYYTLGVIAWQDFLPADREARNSMGMKPEEQSPLKPDTKGKTTKADLKAKYWQSLTDGIEYEKKALEIDPQYENAMSYVSLLTRYRADLLDSKEEYAAAWKEADGWMEKGLQTQKAKAEKKAAAIAAGANPDTLQ